VPKQGRITRDVELRNVMAILPGRVPRRIYVSGHYDTVARPGAERLDTPPAARPRDPMRGRPPRRSQRALDNPRRASTTTAADGADDRAGARVQPERH
jgi:hypothetical protein